MEIVDDTDWYDKHLDNLLQALPLSIHNSCEGGGQSPGVCAATDWFLAGYEHYWGLLGSRGPGNGVANVHIATAKSAEGYFATNYAGQHLLDAPANGFDRSLVLLTDAGNIYYTASYLRMIADYRTGTRSAHTTDLSDLDMQMIYGRFRCDCWNGSWRQFAASSTVPEASRGQVLAPFLDLYR